MTHVLKEIFGDTKRISILEELVERWGEFLKASELARMSDVSKKTVYEHLRELDAVGLLETKTGRATSYKLKEDDKRALALAILESEEYLRKIEISIKEAEAEEKNREANSSFAEFYQSGSVNFSSSDRHLQLEAVGP